MAKKSPTLAEQARIIADRDRTIADHELTIAMNERIIAHHMRTIVELRRIISENVDALAGQVNTVELKDGIYPRADTTLQALLRLMTDLVELKDPYTKGHSLRVSIYSLLIAEHSGIEFPSEKLVALKYAALLHDIGKIAISDLVLNKRSVLTDVEKAMIEEHPLISYRLTAPLDLDPLIREAVLGHHENYDGSGYPGGLRGDEIPLPARVVRIADVYDALTSSRPYRAAFDHKKALEIMAKEQQYFDSKLLDAFSRILSASKAKS